MWHFSVKEDTGLSLHSLNWFLVPEGCLEIPFTAKELLPHSVTAGKAASCPISPGHSLYYLQGREIGWVLLHQLVFSAGLPHAVLSSPMSRLVPLAHCKASTVPQSLSVGCRWTFIHGCKISLVETCSTWEREWNLHSGGVKGKVSINTGCTAVILPEGAALLDSFIVASSVLWKIY